MKTKPHFYLTVAAVCRDETPYLQEWVEYHLLVGVEHFFIYDNDSVVPVEQTLGEYIRTGYVTVVPLPGPFSTGRQVTTYTNALRSFGQTSKWMAFIDIDEFILPKTTFTIPEQLVQFEQTNGLEVFWALFGSNGHDLQTRDFVIERFLTRASADNSPFYNYKSIIRPERATENHLVHAFNYKDNRKAVCETGKPRSGLTIHTNKIAINHYWCKSYEEFVKKRDKSIVFDHKITNRSAHFDGFNSLANAVEDTLLRDRYLDQIKENIKRGPVARVLAAPKPVFYEPKEKPAQSAVPSQIRNTFNKASRLEHEMRGLTRAVRRLGSKI